MNYLESLSNEELLSLLLGQTDESSSLLEGLFDKQRAFVSDPSRRKIAFTSSRAGKTWGVVRAIIVCALERPGNVVYLTDTRDHAKGLAWDDLVNLTAPYAASVNYSELQIKLHNGSRIWLYGIDSARLIERLRGYSYTGVFIDEVQSCNSDVIKTLLTSVLSARLKDHDGQLVLTFTPPEQPDHYVIELLEKDKDSWSVHQWNMFQNPMFPAWSDEPNWQTVANQCRELWQTQESEEVFRREYLGELFWSGDKYIYQLTEAKNLLIQPLQAYDGRILGIDFGFEDFTTFVVHGYHIASHEVHCLYVSKIHHTLYEDIVTEVNKIISLHAPDRIVGDTAGGSKIITESLTSELRRRFNLQVQAADKTQKPVYMKLWASDIKKGSYKCPRNELWQQLNGLIIDPKTQIEKKTVPCDFHDAGLYSWRGSLAYLPYTAPTPEPSYEDRMRDKFLNKNRGKGLLGIR